MSQHDTLKLEPCPFCSGQPELEDCRTVWVVRCECGASVLGTRAPEPEGNETDEYWLGIRQTAIDAWNRRATHPVQTSRPDFIDVQGENEGAVLVEGVGSVVVKLENGQRVTPEILQAIKAVLDAEQAKQSEPDDALTLLAEIRDGIADLFPGVEDGLLMNAIGGPSEVPEYVLAVARSLKAQAQQVAGEDAEKLLDCAHDALQGLLSNIRRDAPQLAGKAMGFAQLTVQAISAHKLRPATTPPAPASQPAAQKVPEGWSIKKLDSENAVVINGPIGGCVAIKDADIERVIPEHILYELACALLTASPTPPAQQGEKA